MCFADSASVSEASLPRYGVKTSHEEELGKTTRPISHSCGPKVTYSAKNASNNLIFYFKNNSFLLLYPVFANSFIRSFLDPFPLLLKTTVSCMHTAYNFFYFFIKKFPVKIRPYDEVAIKGREGLLFLLFNFFSFFAAVIISKDLSYSSSSLNFSDR